MVLYLLSPHYPEERVLVSINKYLYQVFFNEPDVNEPSYSSRVSGPFWSACHFISRYLIKSATTGSVDSDDLHALVQKVFPEMVPYLMTQRCLEGSGIPKPVTATVNFDGLSFHLKNLLPTDWVSLHHTAELEEKRRGLAIR